MPQMDMVHVVDPFDAIMDIVGDLSEIEVPLNKILVGIYVRPNQMKFKNGQTFELTDATVQEDIYQGKAGVVLKKGRLAFEDSETFSFHGFKPEVGDWIAFRPSNGLKIDIRKAHCILLSDTQCELIIPMPDIIF